MLTRLGVGTLVFILGLSQAQAQEPGDICTLGDSVKVFSKQSRRGAAFKMKKGQKLVFQGTQGQGLRVATVGGRVGFAKKSWLMKICRWEKKVEPAAPKLETEQPAPAPAEQPEPIATVPLDDPPDLALQIANNELATVQAEATGATVAAPTGQRLVQIAVYNLELENIPAPIGKIVSNSLLDEIRKLEGVSAIGMEEITQMISLEAQKQIMGCDESESCLAEIAGALGVDEIITGQLTEAADGRTFLIRRINQRRAAVIGTVTKRLKIGSGEEFLLALGPAVEELYAERKNRPGTHRGVPDEIALRLNPPPLPVWSTWTTFAASATALAASGLFYGLAYQENQFYNSGAWENTDTLEGSELTGAYNAGQTYEQAGVGALIAGGSLALSALVMSFFTDWEGHGEEE